MTHWSCDENSVLFFPGVCLKHNMIIKVFGNEGNCEMVGRVIVYKIPVT